jgi:hypothetical protein|tara:strand:+ start:279 stop:524 length:246 start_codon:yes stop_codon:yes gene_type:complete
MLVWSDYTPAFFIGEGMPLDIEPGVYLDLVEAAREVGLHPESLRRIVRYGDLRAIVIERGLYFRQTEVERFKQNRNGKDEV